MIIELNRESHIPLYEQIASQVREMIGRGVLRVGDRLPANRELAGALGVNRSTVTTAYDELTADGLISSHVGRGTFVSALPAPHRIGGDSARPQPSPMPWGALLHSEERSRWLGGMLDALPRRQAISFAYGLPPTELFPLDDFRRATDRVMRRDGRELLQLGVSNGYRPLQDYLAGQMALSGAAVGVDEILITNGCQQSLDLISRILLRPGEEVAIENPTYPGALGVFCGRGAKYVGVPVTAQGLDLDLLEDLLAQRRPKLIYVVPSYQNPTGATMDLKARHRLIELAARARVPIVEDDIYRELRYEGQTLPPLKALDRYGLVIYVNSFSKIGFPGLRIGWVAAPRIVIDHLNAEKQRSDLHASLLVQAAIWEFVRHGALARHIARSRKAYAARRDRMLEALRRYFPADAEWTRPEGGMAVWVRLPAGINSSQLFLQAAEAGVIFSPGESFYCCAPEPNHLRLTFTQAAPAEIEEGVRRLGAIIKTRLAHLKRQRATTHNESCRALV
jgi:2-aminoadipate transaminase